MFPSSLLDVNIASHPSSLDLEEILEEGSPEREETLEDQLTRLLLKEETAFSSPGMVQFRQFPSILHAHTEDGTPFERLKLMHPPLSRSTSPQVGHLFFYPSFLLSFSWNCFVFTIVLSMFSSYHGMLVPRHLGS